MITVTACPAGYAVAQLLGSITLRQITSAESFTLSSKSTMAEVLAIIGLVSNILSFIDFGIKFASGTRNVRDSAHGTTTEVRELELIVEDV